MNARKTGCTDRKQTDHTGKKKIIIEVRERQMNLPPSETGMQVSIESSRITTSESGAAGCRHH
jgi:hypothetical protein